MSMDELLKALLGGAAQARQTQQPQQDALGAVALPDLIQSILGGMAAPDQRPAQGQSQQAPDMGDILGGILGGGAGSAGSQQSSGGLGDILGGILGGGAGSASGQQSSGGLGDILGGILGGGAGSAGGQQSSGGLGDILGGILGGGGTSRGGGVAGSSLLGPIAQALAQKLGLPPAIAQAVISFALGKILPGLLRGLTPQAQPSQAVPRQQTAPSQSGGFNLDDLLDRMGSGSPQRLTTSYLQSSGLATELAQQTGMDDGTAAESLREVFLALGGEMGGASATASAKPKSQGARKPAARTPSKSTPKKTPAKKGQTWEV